MATLTQRAAFLRCIANNCAIPDAPGVYRFYGTDGVLIYVGKAKNLRRRLGQYRNAKRRRAHVKMRKIVKEAARLEFETCATEFHALALENDWIQKHRPKWNVVGAFHFLYPLVGVFERAGEFYLCYTTSPERYPAFAFHGAFRSRGRTREAFFALAELLTLIGHSIPRTKIYRAGIGAPEKHTHFFGYRQVPAEWVAKLQRFFRGDDFTAIEELSLLLIERPGALARAKEVQRQLYAIRRFWRHEITALKRARLHSAWNAYPVLQRDRDRLFIALQSKGSFTLARDGSPSAEPNPPSV